MFFRTQRSLRKEVRKLRTEVDVLNNVNSKTFAYATSVVEAAQRRLQEVEEEDTELITELTGKLEYLLNQYRNLESENLRAAAVLNTQVEILAVVGTTELANTVTVQAVVNEMKDTGTVYTIQKVLSGEDR